MSTSGIALWTRGGRILRDSLEKAKDAWGRLLAESGL